MVGVGLHLEAGVSRGVVEDLQADAGQRLLAHQRIYHGARRALRGDAEGVALADALLVQRPIRVEPLGRAVVPDVVHDRRAGLAGPVARPHLLVVPVHHGAGDVAHGRRGGHIRQLPAARIGPLHQERPQQVVADQVGRDHGLPAQPTVECLDQRGGEPLRLLGVAPAQVEPDVRAARVEQLHLPRHPPRPGQAAGRVDQLVHVDVAAQQDAGAPLLLLLRLLMGRLLVLRSGRWLGLVPRGEEPAAGVHPGRGPEQIRHAAVRQDPGSDVTDYRPPEVRRLVERREARPRVVDDLQQGAGRRILVEEVCQLVEGLLFSRHATNTFREPGSRRRSSQPAVPELSSTSGPVHSPSDGAHRSGGRSRPG